VRAADVPPPTQGVCGSSRGIEYLDGPWVVVMGGHGSGKVRWGCGWRAEVVYTIWRYVTHFIQNSDYRLVVWATAKTIATSYIFYFENK
jgi:hypothetical protein